MKPANHQQAHTNTVETPSNIESNKEHTTVKEESKKLLSHKASAGERAECHAAEAASFQHSG